MFSDRGKGTVSRGIHNIVYYGLVQSTVQYDKAFVEQKKILRNMAGVQGFQLYFDPHLEAKLMVLAKIIKYKSCRVFY